LATRPLKTLGMALVEFQNQIVLVTVDYFSGFLTYDTLDGESTEAVTQGIQ